MDETKDEHRPELCISYPYTEDEAEKIKVKDYKSIEMCDSRLQYSMEVLKKHGGLIRKLFWMIGREITSSKFFEVLSLLPQLEEIRIDFRNQGDIKIDITTAPTFDLTRIKSLHCTSEKSLGFFSSIMPVNCLEEFYFEYGPSSKPRAVNQSIVEKFEKFIQHQPSIKAFSTDLILPLDVLNLLTLEELKILSRGDSIKTEEVLKAIECQPELKTFQCWNLIDDEDLEEICKLTKLEVLTIDFIMLKNGQCLEKLKNLKRLELRCIQEESCLSFFVFKLESLEKLNIDPMWESINIPETLEIISISFPNLKSLELNSSQKINYIAKLFPKLDELELKFNFLWELDTGIINENMRKLNLECDYDANMSFCEIDENFFELFKIFPNMENLRLHTSVPCFDDSNNHTHFITSSFYEKLFNMEKLKSIDLKYLDLNIYKKDLVEFAKVLKKFAQKFKDVHFLFYNLVDVPKSDYNSVKSNYNSFKNELKKCYEVEEENFDYDEISSCLHIHFSICSGFEEY